jgi:hypothetical protein
LSGLGTGDVEVWDFEHTGRSAKLANSCRCYSKQGGNPLSLTVFRPAQTIRADRKKQGK